MLNSMRQYDFNESGICLPYVIEGTALVLESIGEGNASGCAEAVLRNIGSEMLASFYVEIQTESGKYYFETTMLPSGARIILRERDGKHWTAAQLIWGYGSYNTTSVCLDCDFPEVQGNRLLIRNKEPFPVKAMEVYLKPWDEHAQAYLYGKTQKIVLHNLQGDDSVEVLLPDSNYQIVYCMVHNTTAAAYEAAAECFIIGLLKENPVIWDVWVR